MAFSSYRQPYSHRTRFKLVHSTTTLVKVARAIPSTSQFKLIRNATKPAATPVLSPAKPVLFRAKSLDRPSATTVAKSIGNKYKWLRTSLKRTDRSRSVTSSSTTFDRCCSALVSHSIVGRFPPLVESPNANPARRYPSVLCASAVLNFTRIPTANVFNDSVRRPSSQALSHARFFQLPTPIRAELYYHRLP